MEEEVRKAKYLERIKRFRLMDDTFFEVCFEHDVKLTEFVLRILLDKADLHVIRAHSQYSIKNLVGHSVTFDAYATDDEGKKYDIEVQRDNRGAIPKRARYHSSLLDGRSLVKNGKYKDLVETYVIFITENDVMGDGLPLYHIERTVMETGRPFNDEAHIVYVNTSYAKVLGWDEEEPDELSPLVKLMHDFRCANPNDMYYDIFAQRTRYFKENEKGVSHMCEIMEELYEEARQEAEAKFEEEKVRFAEEKEAAMKNAIRMIKDGLKVEKISEYTSLPVEKVQELADLIAG